LRDESHIIKRAIEAFEQAKHKRASEVPKSKLTFDDFRLMEKAVAVLSPAVEEQCPPKNYNHEFGKLKKEWGLVALLSDRNVTGLVGLSKHPEIVKKLRADGTIGPCDQPRTAWEKVKKDPSYSAGRNRRQRLEKSVPRRTPKRQVAQPSAPAQEVPVVLAQSEPVRHWRRRATPRSPQEIEARNAEVEAAWAKLREPVEAKTRWIQVASRSEENDVGYHIIPAPHQDFVPAPTWPTQDTEELLDPTFINSTIEDEDSPALHRLIGMRIRNSE
jgi:hypothetical protein